jgi:HEPN domain-containing protein
MTDHIWAKPWPDEIRKRLDYLAVLEDKAITAGYPDVAEVHAEHYSDIVAEFDLSFAPRLIKALGIQP